MNNNQKIISNKLSQFSYSSKHLFQVSLMYEETKKKEYIIKNIFSIIQIIKDHDFTKDNIFSMKFGLLDLCGLGFVLQQFAVGNSNFDYVNALPQLIKILNDNKIDMSKVLKILSLYTCSVDSYTKFADSSKSVYTDTTGKVTKSFYLRKQPITKDNSGKIVKNTFGMNMIINNGTTKRISPTINVDIERAYSLGRSIELMYERAFRLQLEVNNLSVTKNKMI